MLFNKNINFCDIHPICYAISSQKEIVKRHLKDLLSKNKFAKKIERRKSVCVISGYSSNLIKRGKGIDPRLQENKVTNIMLACDKINGMIIRPGEVFSFWKTVGPATKRRGYKDGRVIVKGKIEPGTGGGLCNLANTINLLILHSPLEIIELHHHSDALAPDNGKRVPFSSGTSVSYNYIDYRFKNNTDQDIQLLVWCDDEKLYGELRSEKEFPWSYKLVEEDHHFQKEGDKYYRVSKIYRVTSDKLTENVLDKELIWDNHSVVMYDYDLIPKEQIKI